MSGDFCVKNGATYVFIGDSITDCGRRDNAAPYGDGYARQVIDLVTGRYPERNITFVNKGISGDTTGGLFNRWHDDVVALKPDWVSILIGINDLHGYLANPKDGISPAVYEKHYRNILDLTARKTKAGLILLEPFYISTDSSGDSFRSRVLHILPEYIKIVHRLAKEHKAVLIKTQEVFQKQLRYRPADRFCAEPVHPNIAGHLVIAGEILKVLSY